MADSAPFSRLMYLLPSTVFTGFTDNFLYPDGPLTGNGNWVLDPFSDPQLSVVSTTVTGGDPGGAINRNIIDMGGFDGQAPWTVEAVVEYTPLNVGAEEMGIFIYNSTESEEFGGGRVRDNVGDGNPTNMVITAEGNFAGTNTNPYTVPLSTDFQLRIQFDGTDVKTYIDGVLAATHSVTGTTPSPAEILLLVDSPAGTSGFFIKGIVVTQP